MASSSAPPSARADGPDHHLPLIPPPSDTGMGAAVPSLLDDPLVDIFSRLPARSLCRFKCVSKAWLALITDPVHRKRLPQALEGFFLMDLMVYCAGSSIYSAGASGHRGEDVEISFVDLTPARPVPLDIDPFPSSLKELTAIQVLSFHDSCNGLLLFDYHPETDPLNVLGYVVCNPTTKQWGSVPPCSCSSPTCYYPHTKPSTYLAFDPAASPHFHLVQCQSVQGQKVGQLSLTLHIYSSETGTWTHTKDDEQEDLGRLRVFVPRYRHSAAFVNGILHVLPSGRGRHRIIAVDIQRKTRKMIRAPAVDEVSGYISYFGQSQGHLYCITGEDFHVPREGYIPSYVPQEGCELSFWVLQDYDAQEWVLKGTVSSLDLSEKMRFLGDGCKGNSVTIKVVDIHQDRDMVFFTQPFNKKLLLAYDMGRKEVSAVVTSEKHDWLMDCARYFPCFSESSALTNKL